MGKCLNTSFFIETFEVFELMDALMYFWTRSARKHGQKAQSITPVREDICIPVTTVNFLNIRTPKIFVVITLKFELCGSTIE